MQLFGGESVSLVSLFIVVEIIFLTQTKL